MVVDYLKLCYAIQPMELHYYRQGRWMRFVGRGPLTVRSPKIDIQDLLCWTDLPSGCCKGLFLLFRPWWPDATTVERYVVLWRTEVTKRQKCCVVRSQ